jgi:hypothetical protein
MTYLFPTSLPNGSTLWYGSALPSLAGDGQFTAGDYFWVMTATAGLPTLWRCTATGNGATAVFQLSTGEAANVTAASAAYTVQVTDDIVIQSGNAAVNLPAASTLPNDVVTVKNTNASGGTVVASSGIDSGHTVTLVQNAAVRLVSNGTQWYAVGGFGSSAIS